jgi:hypothetical protein
MALMTALNVPTRFNGHRFADGRFSQHPTARGTGIWQEDRRTGDHGRHDRARSEMAATAMNAAFAEPDATPESAARAGTAAGGMYSLNEKIGPPRGDNMRPASTDDATLDAAESERELLKLKLRDEYGAPMESGTQLNTAAWSGGEGKSPKRPLSPSRLRPGESVDDYHQRLAAYKKTQEREEQVATRGRSRTREERR